MPGYQRLVRTRPQLEPPVLLLLVGDPDHDRRRAHEPGRRAGDLLQAVIEVEPGHHGSPGADERVEPVAPALQLARADPHLDLEVLGQAGEAPGEQVVEPEGDRHESVIHQAHAAHQAG